METEFFSQVGQKTEAGDSRKSPSPSRSHSASRSPSVENERPTSPKDSRSPSKPKSPVRSRSRSRSVPERAPRSRSREPTPVRSRSPVRRGGAERYGTNPNHCSLIVRGFRDVVDRSEIQNIFSKYGNVHDVHIPRDYYTHKQRGFAFIEFENREQAEDAISHLDGRSVCGSTVSVSIAKNNRKTSAEMRRLYPSRRSRSRSYRRSRSRSYRRSRSRSRSRRSRSYPRRSRSPSYDRRRSYPRRSSSRGRYERRPYSRYD
ncbi:uncharacterized protein [Blastocystis hominis]|uniref:RRM domain-containing protein n=1 Tax=Blastocystis hominis TaxID=12968 RepID=D8M5R2_BLAHO|nr:uncharacterized protein [Blastocystis hominis]CBK23401.2 unnamed protein product [Blastocystis hominis]|eukprot:XP_012897449.1 uncharacterized protein [Blastocystis hominis]